MLRPIAMIKLVYCIRRRSDLRLEEFQHYWLHSHAALVTRVAEAIGARRYVQSHTIEPAINEALVQPRGLAPAYDGITEIWWDDVAAFQTALTEDRAVDAARKLLEDEAKFIDFAASCLFLTREHVIFER